MRHAHRETLGFAIGGFAVYILAERAVHVLAEVVGSHTRAYFYLSAVPFWRAITAIECYLVPLMIGWLMARVARGREVMVALSVGSVITAWLLAFYTSWLLTTAGAQILVPDLSLTPMLYDVHSAPPHGPSLSNTLTHLRLTLAYWWIPAVILMVIGAITERATAIKQTLGNQAA